MRWHHRLGHLSFAKLKKLAILGKIPKRLARSSLQYALAAFLE